MKLVLLFKEKKIQLGTEVFSIIKLLLTKDGVRTHTPL